MPTVPDPKALETVPIMELAKIVRGNWKNVNFAAAPYLQAMSALYRDDDRYGMDTAESVCTYFLSNATTWRGPVARVVKAEIKRRFKIK